MDKEDTVDNFSSCKHKNGSNPVETANSSAFLSRADIKLCKSENPQDFQLLFVENPVDNVDNLLSEQFFAHFYDVSGPHSYQQIAGDTIF